MLLDFELNKLPSSFAVFLIAILHGSQSSAAGLTNRNFDNHRWLHLLQRIGLCFLFHR